MAFTSTYVLGRCPECGFLIKLFGYYTGQPVICSDEEEPGGCGISWHLTVSPEGQPAWERTL